MKSELEFVCYETDKPSDCGQVLDIDVCAAALNWPGIVLERGRSPHFYPDNVYTPYFYFALAMEQELNWRAGSKGDSRVLKTSPGDIWINPPDTPFSHQISEPCYFTILAVEKAVFLDSVSLNTQGRSLQFLNNYNVHDEVIKGIIDLFMLEVQSGGRNGPAYVNHLLSLLATHYINNYSNYPDLLDAGLSHSRFDQHQFEQIDRYIDTHLSGNIQVDDLAALLGCSKFYFLREFKKLADVTPYQYIIARRLARARQRLASSDISLGVLAGELGFNDQAHFTRSFKKEYGVTPGQFRKAQRG